MIVNKYNLFIDTNKSPIDGYIKTRDKVYINEEWETTQDVEDAYNFIVKKGMPNVISMKGNPNDLLEYCKKKELNITSKILIHG